MELILDNIYKSYGSLPVLSGVSMKIASPDICCLMAPSGTGKTTLFRLIMGLEKPDSGTICPAPEQIRFSAVFQEDRLIPEFSPLENVALALPGVPTGRRFSGSLQDFSPRKRSSARSLL